MKVFARTEEEKKRKEQPEYKPIYAEDIFEKKEVKSKKEIVKPQALELKKEKPALQISHGEKKKSWKNYLSSSSTLKDAIILSEILAKPLCEREF
jgi:hypothetical protein